MSNDENKETDANKKMTAAEFLNGALAGKFDVGALMPFLLEAKEIGRASCRERV